MPENMVEKKSWDECRESCLLWWINMILHTFGWAICVEIGEERKVVDAYPARVKYRGFAEKNNDEGYIRVSKYLADNSDELRRESECQ